MKRLLIIPVLLTLMACELFSLKHPITETPPPFLPSETSCPGNDCSSGCGAACATFTPDAAFAPLATVQGAGEWIVKSQSDSFYDLDPSGAKPGFVILDSSQQLPVKFIFARDGAAYSMSESDGSFEIEQILPKEGLTYMLDARWQIRGSMGPIAPIFSSDGQSLVWSRADEEGATSRALFVTSLNTGESREVWRLELSANAEGYALVPIFYDAAKQKLIYALHTFYSGMTSTQVASLYEADIAANKVTPLWALNPDKMYAGVSASVSPNGRLLAYLTWGEPQANHTLPWTLHLRDLTSGKETTHRLAQTWDNAEIHLFAPDGNKVLLTASRRVANGDGHAELLVFNLQDQTWNSIYTPDYNAKPYLNPRAWSGGDWLILTSDADFSTWVIRPDGTALTQITPLKWVGLLDE